ncbi:hypothetical protein P3T36_004778 [Kitasatospora sp. MAP12-15]|uniref:DUF2207 family protein n=1 Tax=unclassified Kitasatospora TaxID=2633591 RepID=UPI0024731576|nr:DUF2207 domain-containing protein [Kitasatospora sp. MAP12-44]MDH6110290.1 hypothetical protein [Kitasatospora sp. MAP12-44]
MSAPEEFAAAGAAALLGWLLAFALALLATRNGTVVPAPATQELGDQPEPPAVVSLLAADWRSTAHAAESTLLDLVARGHLELRQAGDDPADTTVHLTSHSPTVLRPYEHRVLARVTAQAGAAGAPIGAIAFRDAKQAVGWHLRLRQEIIAEARLRGLSRPRFSKALILALFTGTFVPAVLLGLAVLALGHAHSVRPAFAVGALTVLVLGWLGQRAIGERATPAGLARAGHWQGVRSWLRAHESFAELPPAAVTVWERYLAYGTALGVTTRAARLLDFGNGDRHRVWSGYGGSWREVRIRYPRLRPGYGAAPSGLRRRALAAATVAVGGLLFSLLRQPSWAVADGPLSADSLRRPGLLLVIGWMLIAALALAVVGRFNRPTLTACVLAGMLASAVLRNGARHAMEGPLVGEWVVIGVFAALAGYFLVLAALDGRSSATLTGEVLRIESRHNPKWPNFLALDDGSTDRTVAWALPGPAAGFATGSTVRVTVSQVTHRVRVVQVLALGADYQAQQREPSPIP